jgi:hypothetical protein
MAMVRAGIPCILKHRLGLVVAVLTLVGAASAPPALASARDILSDPLRVDSNTLDHKIMVGYQGWFRCPGDAAGMGWVHWSRDSKRLARDTLTFEMWPDVSEYGADELFPAPGFTHPDGRPARLFSSDNAATVYRHFGWMSKYEIDGAWLQHFVVDLPGGPSENRYPSRLRVLAHVRAAARATGRVWALAYDISGMPGGKTFDILTRDWKKMVDDKVIQGTEYLHHRGLPVVQVWGFYRDSGGIDMSPALANRLIDFFSKPGPYAAYLVAGGDWDWRRNPRRDWQAVYDRFDVYMPWNVGNYITDKDGVKRASTDWWSDDIKECKRRKIRWIPVVYPGFSWDNLQKKPPGTSLIPRRRGAFLWEQFHKLAQLGVDSAYVAMFDEVDEGTAIFKVADAPPKQAHFVGLEGMPSDWYLRLVREGARMLRGGRPVSDRIPISP